MKLQDHYLLTDYKLIKLECEICYTKSYIYVPTSNLQKELVCSNCKSKLEDLKQNDRNVKE